MIVGGLIHFNDDSILNIEHLENSWSIWI